MTLVNAMFQYMLGLMYETETRNFAGSPIAPICLEGNHYKKTMIQVTERVGTTAVRPTGHPTFGHTLSPPLPLNF